jgi:hypothetical protein
MNLLSKLEENMMFIGGKWRGSPENKLFPVKNPANIEEVVGSYEVGNRQTARAALEAAQALPQPYKPTPAGQQRTVGKNTDHGKWQADQGIYWGGDRCRSAFRVVRGGRQQNLWPNHPTDEFGKTPFGNETTDWCVSHCFSLEFPFGIVCKESSSRSGCRLRCSRQARLTDHIGGYSSNETDRNGWCASRCIEFGDGTGLRYCG